ncbi:MAG: 50S ribosomal protein L18 [Actinobacteria bacterium]|nr:50S ribosomal protein L18 [Actinomycetota bacterium]
MVKTVNPAGRADKASQRRRRHVRVRNKVIGTAARPRLAVFRSSKHISAQIIDDNSGRTLAAASTEERDLRAGATANVAAAAEVGRRLAERAKEAGVGQVVFDRGGYRYHGRVAALADAARHSGLEF